MELLQFKKETDIFQKKNPSSRLILQGEIKEDYEVTKCAEFGESESGEPPVCLREERIYFKKGDSVEGIDWFFYNDDGGGNPITDGEITVPYQNGFITIFFSKINIKGFKGVTADEKSKIKNDLDTTGNRKPATENKDVVTENKDIVKETPTSTNENISQSFLQKNQNYLLFVGAIVLGYFAYKKFKNYQFKQ
jgi:hypothetical protein